MMVNSMRVIDALRAWLDIDQLILKRRQPYHTSNEHLLLGPGPPRVRFPASLRRSRPLRRHSQNSIPIETPLAVSIAVRLKRAGELLANGLSKHERFPVRRQTVAPAVVESRSRR